MKSTPTDPYLKEVWSSIKVCDLFDHEYSLMGLKGYRPSHLFNRKYLLMSIFRWISSISNSRLSTYLNSENTEYLRKGSVPIKVSQYLDNNYEIPPSVWGPQIGNCCCSKKSSGFESFISALQALTLSTCSLSKVTVRRESMRFPTL